MFIRSERLFLRPAWPEERAELYRLPACDALFAADMVRPKRHPQFLVTLPGPDGADPVGLTGLIDNGPETELAVWIAPDFRNRGYATEAARATLAVAGTVGHCRLIAHHYADSPATARMLAKLGFVPTGHMRMHHSALRGGPALAQVHALNLCPPASDPVDPEELRRAA
jgi:RimJ/RimL family protein N-acetyltransferase